MIGGMTEMIKRHYHELKSPYTHIDVDELSNLVNRSVYFSEYEQPLEDLFDDVQAVVLDHSLHISHPGNGTLALSSDYTGPCCGSDDFCFESIYGLVGSKSGSYVYRRSSD
ncbi:hypothetical protein MUB16_13750 [Priestia sp. OVL9]|nr:hypothetical protein [Priestia sp. OVL9]